VPWIIAGGAALVLLIAAVVFLVSRDDETASSTATTDRTETTDTTEPSDTTETTEPTDETEPTEPESDVISIGVVGYTPLEGDWLRFEGTLPEFPGADGQFQVTQDDAPDGSWTANVIVSFLDPTIAFNGPQDLEPAARALADKIINGGVYYPAGTTSQIVLAEARDIDGHQAFVIRSELQFSVPGLNATGETVQVAVIDTGVLPATFWGSIPNTNPELIADLDSAFQSLVVEE
jgi:hypothetical protein